MPAALRTRSRTGLRACAAGPSRPVTGAAPQMDGGGPLRERALPRNAGEIKRPFVPNIGTKGMFPFRGTTQIRARRRALEAPVTEGGPAVSPRRLPGEPNDTRQGGFQPAAASLLGAQTRYFPVHRCCKKTVSGGCPPPYFPFIPYRVEKCKRKNGLPPSRFAGSNAALWTAGARGRLWGGFRYPAVPGGAPHNPSTRGGGPGKPGRLQFGFCELPFRWAAPPAGAWATPQKRGPFPEAGRCRGQAWPSASGRNTG